MLHITTLFHLAVMSPLLILNAGHTRSCVKWRDGRLSSTCPSNRPSSGWRVIQDLCAF